MLNRRESMSQVVVVINGVTELVMPVVRARESKCPNSLDPPPSVHIRFCSPQLSFASSGPPVAIIFIIKLFDIKLPGNRQRITNLQLQVVELPADCLTRNKCRPVPTFLYHCTSKHANLLKLNEILQNTEAGVKNNIPSRCEVALQHPHQEPGRLPQLTIPLCDLRRMVFPLNHLHHEHDARQSTACCMVFITKWPWFVWTKHPPGASPSVVPDGH